MIYWSWILTFCFFLNAPQVFGAAVAKKTAKSAIKSSTTENNHHDKEISIPEMMELIRKRAAHFQWDLTHFHDEGWKSWGTTINKLPLIYWSCGAKENKNRSLILSAVHGDEITPVYYGFRLVEWLKARPEYCKNTFIVVAPIVNPDGFLRYQTGTRTNYNKVDVNRNFDTPEWNQSALKEWKQKYKSQRRYFPGDQAASEPETKFQKWLIEEFQPQKIMSVHSPLNVLDYDGPEDPSQGFSKEYKEACDQLKTRVKKATPNLNFFAYGTFPGSLGNYAGRHRGIPTFTAELPTADGRRAGEYFTMMEKGLKLFLDYEILPEPKFSPEPKR